MTSISTTDTAAELVKRRYNRSAPFYDLEQALPERFFVGRLRRSLWSRVNDQDRILEVGVGTGANIAHYPLAGSVTAIDISDRMLEKARARAERIGATVDPKLMDAQRLEFEDASFDTVVATFVFCSVPDPVAGFREALRVLRPGGRLLLLEHVRSENAFAGKLMDWLNPLAVRLTGANINRRTVDNVRQAGFADVQDSHHLFNIVRLVEAMKAPATAA